MRKTGIMLWVSAFALASICAILAIIVLKASKSTVSQLSVQTTSGSRTVDFGDMRYGIPDAYRPGITPYRAKGYEKGKGYAAFTLSLLLPDLRPQGTSDEGMTGHGWGRHLHALFEYGLSLREQQDIVDQLLEWGRISKNDYSVENNRCHLYQGKMTVTHELHVCPLPSRLFVYTCKTKTEVPFPSCRVQERINSDTTLIYSYSQEFSDIAVEIDEHIRALANSFLKTNTSSQTP